MSAPNAAGGLTGATPQEIIDSLGDQLNDYREAWRAATKERDRYRAALKEVGWYVAVGQGEGRSKEEALVRIDGLVKEALEPR